MIQNSVTTFAGGVIFTLVLLDPVYVQIITTEATSKHLYQNITPLCPLEELCINRTDEDTLSVTYQCQCDAMCSFYENCCRDSPYFLPSDVPKTNFTCINLSVKSKKDIQIKVIAHCPPYADHEEHRLCENPDETSFLLGRVPITVTAHNISVVYSSVYCARCNINSNADVTYDLWNTTLVCSGSTPGSKLFPDDAEAVWDPKIDRYKYTEGNLTLNCDNKVFLPDHLTLLLRHIRCKKSYIDQCPENWPNPTDARLCNGYTAQVKRKGKLYKNQHCVKCHHGDLKDVSCETHDLQIIPRIGGIPTDSSKYSIIMRYVRSECGPGAHYDAILKECVQLFPPRVFLQEKDVAPIDTCPLVTLSQKHFQLSPDNFTVSVPTYKRNFSQGHFQLTDDGQLQICGEDAPQPPPTVMSHILSIVTVVGLSLSIMFLLFHLCAVALIAELRNLSGMTLASLCVALLGAYISFIVGSTLKTFVFCYISAIVTYVFFMTSFFWMLVLAFDVTKVVRLSVRKFRSSFGFKWRRFTVYSIIAWGVPILLGTAAHLVDQAAHGSVDDRFRPHFALHGCWFHSPNSLLVFFIIPLAVIMILNFSFFVYATVITSENSTGPHKNLRVYVKLTILLGLSWIVGLLASALDNDILWIIFSVLNTLQGLFIFLSFTLTSKVWKGLSKRVAYFRKPRTQTPPEFKTKETSFSTKTSSLSQNSMPTQ